MRKVYRLANDWKDRQFDNGFIQDKSGNLIKKDKRYKIGTDYVRFQIMADGEGWITKDIFKPLRLPSGIQT